MHKYTPAIKTLSTTHSTAVSIQNTSYVPCSAATKVHNITDTPTCLTDSVLYMHSTGSAYKDRAVASYLKVVWPKCIHTAGIKGRVEPIMLIF